MPPAPGGNTRGRGTLVPTRCHTVIKLPSPPPAGNPYSKLFDYYAAQDIFPTYSGFESADGLRRHEYLRRRAFADKLKLPARSLRGARLIEFGPDTGENALVFAQWGASCTLVEPNVKAHAKVREYFARFGLSDGLEQIIEADISQFAGRPEAARQYDLVIAEGFIYTVKPESVWINLFHDLLVDEGQAVFSFYDPASCVTELMLKAVHAAGCRKTDLPRRDVAHRLFATKWASIAHRRSLDSWIMDVLENPFVRLAYFLDARELCRSMREAGFSLYSAWPGYDDSLDVHWFKKLQAPDDRLRSQQRFIERSRLGHLFGKSIFIVDDSLDVERLWKDLVGITDGLIDGVDAAAAARGDALLAELDGLVQSPRVMAPATDRAEAHALAESYRRLLRVITSGTFDELTDFCNTDQAFIREWGVPNHYAVFTRLAPQAG